MQNPPFTNNLIHETSPYLLQHAHNPVNWVAWNEEAWKKAKAENKLVLVSIGYSSCHWCHVMEHESFEDMDTASLMNEDFICIKVDREERPDVDQVYMSAVQLMTGQGGWPLNCFCLPDGKPVYGGTYFPNAQWKNVLMQLKNFYAGNQQKAEEYAEELTQGVRRMEFAEPDKTEVRFSRESLKAVVANWKKHMDLVEGSTSYAPKFPMPNNYEFLLHYAVAEKDESLKQYVLLTLDKMAFGGIYDQVGGGFARYSTDSFWKVPHFEKMLYDNAQLVSLYSHAYQLTKKELYRQVVFETLEFIEREMTSEAGGFYSALDADSEGEEGKFYVWTKPELEKELGDKYAVFADYFNVNGSGHWEHGNHILLRKDPEEVIAVRNGLTVEQLSGIITESKSHLLSERNKRIRPGLDNKILTSWNALMTIGYCDAYEAFGEKKFLDAAINAAAQILNSRKRNGSVPHVLPKPGISSIPDQGEKGNAASGFLEDYSLFIEALIKLYETTFEEWYLEEARQLAEYAIKHFFDPETELFFFTSSLEPKLIARKKEIHDNVIPASNSSMAKGLFLLGKYFDQKEFSSLSQRMLHNVQGQMAASGSSFSNWCELMMWNVYPFYEIAIAGTDAGAKRKELSQSYLPNTLIAGTSAGNSKLPILENRFTGKETMIYVCENYACRLPVKGVHEALTMLSNESKKKPAEDAGLKKFLE